MADPDLLCHFPCGWVTATGLFFARGGQDGVSVGCTRVGMARALLRYGHKITQIWQHVNILTNYEAKENALHICKAFNLAKYSATH
jgi:hypothetical protein